MDIFFPFFILIPSGEEKPREEDKPSRPKLISASERLRIPTPEERLRRG